MAIYFITFAVSILCAYLSYKSKSKFNKFLFGILAVLIPSFLAGCRNKGVGTDTIHYIDGTFNLAKASISFSNMLKVCNVEFLYTAVNYIVSRFTTNINALYFVLQWIICSITYIACCRLNKVCPSWLSYATFLFLFFNKSLNMCRQSIALSFTLLSFSYAIDKKVIRYLIFALCAIGFHRTAIIFLPMYLLVKYVQTNGKFLFKFFTYLTFILIVIFYKDIVSMITTDLNLISNRYMYYTIDTQNNVLMLELLGKLIAIALILLFSNRLKKLNKINHILVFIMILDLLLYCVGFYANYAQRLSYYLGYLVIFLLPQLMNVFKRNKNHGIILIVFLACIAGYSYLYYGFMQYDQTVPYKSDILNIGGN